MGKDISLILADGQAITDVINASRQDDATDSVLKILVQSSKRDESFTQYITEVLDQEAMTVSMNFNTGPGFVTSWLLASVRPSWYFRNSSVSLFLESQNIPSEDQYRYITDWTPIVKEALENISSVNRFAAENYSLGCFISPENCQNFFDDYKQKPGFKEAVIAHFGILTAGLLDAMQSAIETSTGLIESTDLFVPTGADPTTGKWQIIEQLCYTINTYNQTNYALQIFSIETQKLDAQSTIYMQQGQEEKAAACNNRISSLVALMTKNGNNYINEVSHKVHLDIPRLSAKDWGF